jgi:hypothetical protein
VPMSQNNLDPCLLENLLADYVLDKNNSLKARIFEALSSPVESRFGYRAQNPAERGESLEEEFLGNYEDPMSRMRSIASARAYSLLDLILDQVDWELTAELIWSSGKLED